MTTAMPHASTTGPGTNLGPNAAGGGAPASVGARLRENPAVLAAVRAIVEQAKAASAQITDARPGRPELKASYDALMARAAVVRGRPLLYPYLASGAGNGPLVELLDGSVKWDMISGIGVHYFGHSDPDMVEQMALASLDDTVKSGNLQSGMEAYELLETILREAGKNSRLKHGYIATSGAMANENALKVCMQKHGASRVLAFKDCFMGRSISMLSVGDNHVGREGLPINIAVDYMPFYDPVAAQRMGKARYIDMAVWHLDQYVTRYPGQHACFIFELIQGEGGFNVGDRDFFKALMEYCKSKKIAVWDDEIQTFARTPRMFAYEHFDLGQYVDVFCVGKLTQACMTLYTEEYNPKAGLLSGTFTGEGVSFRVGKRVIERLRDGAYFGENGLIARHHAAFREHMRALVAKHPQLFPAVKELGWSGTGDPDAVIGGVGGMMRFTPFGGSKEKAMAALKTCFDEGVILFYCGHGPYHMRMLPPMGVMKLEDWPRVFACLERGLLKVAV